MRHEELLKVCNMGERKAVRRYEGKRKTGRPRRRYLGNIRTDLTKIRKSMLIRFNLLKMEVLADPCASLGVKSGSFPHISDCSFQERLCSVKVVVTNFYI